MQIICYTKAGRRLVEFIFSKNKAQWMQVASLGFWSYVPKYVMQKRILRELSIFTNPFARAGYDTRSIFLKRSLTGLNSEFSFS